MSLIDCLNCYLDQQTTIIFIFNLIVRLSKSHLLVHLFTLAPGFLELYMHSGHGRCGAETFLTYSHWPESYFTLWVQMALTQT